MPEEQADRIIESLARINVNLESLRISLSTLADTSVDHEQRLREMERWKHHLTPVLAVITFVLGAIGSVAVDRLL